MEFLKSILGDGFDAFCEKISDYNSSNPDAEIELVNAKSGDFCKKADFDELSGQLEKSKNQSTDLQKQLERAKFDSALDLALLRAGAKNTLAVRALLDTESGDAQSVIDSIESIKRDNPYLFQSAGATGMRQGGASSGAPSAAEEIGNTLFGRNK